MQQVTGGSRNHSLLSGRFIAALTRRLAGEANLTIDGLGVAIPLAYLYRGIGRAL